MKINDWANETLAECLSDFDDDKRLAFKTHCQKIFQEVHSDIVAMKKEDFCDEEKFLKIDVYIEQGMLAGIVQNITTVNFATIKLAIKNLVLLRCYLIAKGGEEYTSASIKNFIKCLINMDYEIAYKRIPLSCPPDKLINFAEQIWNSFKDSELYSHE